MKYIYILIVYFLVTIILQKSVKIKLWNNGQERKAAIAWFALVFLTGVIADYYASTLNKIWIFPGNEIIGTKILGLPIEEYFFFLIIPYFVLVLYKVINKLFSV